MLYATYMQKAKEVCIDRFVESGKWYLEPDWRIILRDNQLNNFKLQDAKIDWSIVEDVLKLEVEKRNARDNKLGYVADWLYDTLTSTVEPAMLSEETDLVKNMLGVQAVFAQDHNKMRARFDSLGYGLGIRSLYISRGIPHLHTAAFQLGAKIVGNISISGGIT